MNVWGCKFDLAIKNVKDQSMTIILTNLLDLMSPMLYTKIQPQSVHGSVVEDF